VGVEQGPLSLESAIEELLGRNGSASGLESREYGHSDLLRWPQDTPLLEKVGTNFTDKRRSLGRYSILLLLHLNKQELNWIIIKSVRLVEDCFWPIVIIIIVIIVRTL
jgi:hypothetical protein